MAKQKVHPINTESPDEVINSLLAREGDVPGMRYMKYKGVVPDIWRELKLHTIKYAQRFLIDIDKRTNSLILPDGFLHLSSVSVLDECNNIISVSANPDLDVDFIDVGLDHDCHCECGCKSDLCGQIKSYENIITETLEEMPSGDPQPFTSITRKIVKADGSFVIERTVPVRKYEDGEWIGVELETETEELCKLEVKECGCVTATTANKNKVNECCNATTFAVECGGICPPEPDMAYSLTALDGRIAFPSKFGYDKAIVRCYMEDKVKDIRIPLIAKPAFIAGLKHFTYLYEEKAMQWKIRQWEKTWTQETGKLFTFYNRMSFKQTNQALNPKRVMPS